ncbi:MAG: family 10 glycosylhydrolase, partial [Muribaculaceae bacterium]|nr:family 10 glycosylhydrolase [Muribaculaceae bacterium]
ANGIEVYAWFNPYRYNNNVSYSGANEYENTHPDWLIKNSQQTTLNPGMEEVKQRIVDVIVDCVTKYDVDGVVFDDYFYPAGGTSTGTDAPDYALWQQKGNGLSFADWRRANVNEMVKRVNEGIKAVKPYLAFGISPAGVASPGNVTSEYGLPAISGDWQYNQIYSDPLQWLKAGTIDFISPQVYWPNRFNELDAWWNNAARKFNRHYYPSVDISDVVTTTKTTEFIREQEVNRENATYCEGGMVFFHQNQWVNNSENVFGTRTSFGNNMQMGAYPSKALTPLRTWGKIETPAMPANVSVAGSTLTWTEIPGMRYTVYAHPKSDAAGFGYDIADLHGVTYTNSYALPSDADSYDWFVATYDRYGNESAPIGVGMKPISAVAPKHVYPGNGAEPDILFDFKWESVAGRSILEVAEDAAFSNIIATVSAGGAKTLSMTKVAGLEAGKTYWWRVRLTPVGGTPVVSEATSFVAPQLRVLSPAADATGVSLTPTISWTNGGAGTQFKLEVSTSNTFSSLVYSLETTDHSATIPAKKLMNGRRYYARVTATLNENTLVSETSQFTIANVNHTAPALAGGIAAGVLHANEYVEVQPWEGMNQVTVQIATSTSFPSRSSLNVTLKDFATKGDKTAAELKIVSTPLKENTTYYARTRATYYVDNASKTTAWSDVKTFTYSTEAGVNDVVSDGSAAVKLSGNVLTAPAASVVNVYNVAGALVETFTMPADGSVVLTLTGAHLLQVTAPDAAPVTVKYMH